MAQRRETALQRRMRMRESQREWSRRKREGLPTRGVFAAYPNLPEDLPPPARRVERPPAALQGKATLAWLEMTLARPDLPESVRRLLQRKIHRRKWRSAHYRAKRRMRRERSERTNP